MTLVAKYLLFLTPMLIYNSTPISVMVAVLVTFGVLSKNNEITAMKACGVSLYRLAVPVVLAGGVISLVLFAFDHYIIPDANVVQDAIRNQIKGKPVQTFLRPDRKWIFGNGSRIFYYKYMEQNEGVMGGVSVFELDKDSFGLKKHITAERARWEAQVLGRPFLKSGHVVALVWCNASPISPQLLYQNCTISFRYRATDSP